MNPSQNIYHERLHLSFDNLILEIKKEFEKIKDTRVDPEYTLSDILMGAFAMFSLKDPSLLAFEKRLSYDKNLRAIYKFGKIPSDSQIRNILDEINPDENLRKPFKIIFSFLQRGKILEKFKSINDSYLLSADGTKTFSSHKVHGSCCMVKGTKNPLYHHMMFAASIVHPDLSEVIPVMPEMIHNHDGVTKNDCEFNAAKRFINSFRREHPHLNITYIADGLSSKAPLINILREHKMHYLLMAKEGDHKHLFTEFENKQRNGHTTQVSIEDSKKKRMLYFSFHNDLPLNKENSDVRVCFLECKQVDKNNKMTTFTWVTDHEITKDNVYEISRAGRARWKIENETFNTLKNQGYHIEHNYGHGDKHLSSVFSVLTVLAFLVDQVQQMSNELFQAALGKIHARIYFWEKVRFLFSTFDFQSMKEIYEAIAFGFKKLTFEINYRNSS
jgi:hypothetical protein